MTVNLEANTFTANLNELNTSNDSVQIKIYNVCVMYAYLY